MIKFAKRILLFVPFASPARQAAACAKEAAPVAISQIGLPHTLLIIMVMIAGALEGTGGIIMAGMLSALAEVFIIAPSLAAGTFPRQMALVFAAIHCFIASAVAVGLA